MSKDKKIKKAEKSYDNRKFIHSREGREIRLLAEYAYPLKNLKKHHVSKFVIFFGSARSISTEELNSKISVLESKLKKKPGKKSIISEIETLKSRADMSKAYDDAVELARLFSEWSYTLAQKKRMHVCTGGGPGMMEAANKGAHLANARSVGLNISLPFEQYPNQYISPELNFEFHYFFMRKFWFVYKAVAIIAFPGGFGTLDELMELLTLRQTRKSTKPLPIVLFGKEFWDNVVNFDYLVKKGVIDQKDLDLFRYFDEPQEAFEYLKTELSRIHKI